MRSGKPSVTLTYFAVMLVAAGFVLFYFVRGKPGPKTATGADQPRTNQPLANQPLANQPRTNEGSSTPQQSGTLDGPITSGDLAAIKAAIPGADLNAPITSAPYAGLTPLHVLATRTVPGAITALAAAGANVDGQTPDGRTALMLAAQQGLTSAMEELITANASVDMRDGQGRSALMLAAGAARSDAVKLLLHSGAAINAADSTGATAVAFAASMPGNIACLRPLIDAGADCDVPDTQGVTPLMRAAEKADGDQVVLLLNSGASPVGKSRDGKTALDRAKARTDSAGKQVADVLGQAG